MYLCNAKNIALKDDAIQTASERDHLTLKVTLSEEDFMLCGECEDLRAQDFSLENIKDLFCFYPPT